MRKPKEMYNSKIKEQFIEEAFNGEKQKNTASVARTIFKSLAEYEEDWGADFCTRSLEEIKPMLDNVLGMRVSSKWMGISILQKYSDWYAEKGYFGVTHAIELFDVDRSGHEKIGRQMVANPIQLQQYLDDVFKPESKETIDIIYRCYLWMAYMGISEVDALKVKNDDVDFIKMKIKFGEKEAPMYRESLTAFRHAVSLTRFLYEHDNYRNKVISRNRVESDLLLRGIKANATWRTIRSEISRKISKAATDIKDENGKIIKPKTTEVTLSFYRIWISGLFYRMYEHERAGGEVDFLDAAKENIGKVRVSQDGKPSPYNIGKRESEKQRLNRKVRDYKEDYDRWKFVFGI